MGNSPFWAGWIRLALALSALALNGTLDSLGTLAPAGKRKGGRGQGGGRNMWQDGSMADDGHRADTVLYLPFPLCLNLAVSGVFLGCSFLSFFLFFF
jgi:hypothetical protein